MRSSPHILLNIVRLSVNSLILMYEYDILDRKETQHNQPWVFKDDVISRLQYTQGCYHEFRGRRAVKHQVSLKPALFRVCVHICVCACVRVCLNCQAGGYKGKEKWKACPWFKVIKIYYWKCLEKKLFSLYSTAFSLLIHGHGQWLNNSVWERERQFEEK